jgi:hypothetical protein
MAMAAIGAFATWRLAVDGDTAELVLSAAVAIGTAPALADRAGSTLASSPTSRRWRAIARLVIIVPTALVSWMVGRAVALHNIAGGDVAPGLAGWVPGRNAFLALAVLGFGALAAETLTDPGGTTPGLGGALAVLMTTAVVLFLPPTWAILPIEENRWRWLAILAAMVLLLTATLTDRGRLRRAVVTSAGGPPPRSPGARRTRR